MNDDRNGNDSRNFGSPTSAIDTINSINPIPSIDTIDSIDDYTGTSHLLLIFGRTAALLSDSRQSEQHKKKEQP
jgi:hypothetical protein